jgi:hypothetical protein
LGARARTTVQFAGPALNGPHKSKATKKKVSGDRRVRGRARVGIAGAHRANRTVPGEHPSPTFKNRRDRFLNADAR